MKKTSECRELCLKKEEGQARKKKEREEKRADKQTNSQLAQVVLFIGEVCNRRIVTY